MKSVRFPLRDRVQEPNQKCYVLLQAAVGSSLEIKDFALKIEQADILENASRLLKGLHDLCVQRELGPLLEACILLERALRTRLWEGPNSCQFLQCPGLSSDTVKTLQAVGMNSVTEVYGSSLAQVQQRANCDAAEARQLLQFAASVHRCRLSAQLVMGTDHKVKIKVELVEIDRSIVGLQAMPFELLCYDVRTSRLVCHRRLPAGCNGTEVSVKLPEDTAGITTLRCRILGSLVGADFACGAAPIDDLSATNATKPVRTAHREVKQKEKEIKNDDSIKPIPLVQTIKKTLSKHNQAVEAITLSATPLMQLPSNLSAKSAVASDAVVNFDRFKLVEPSQSSYMDDNHPSPTQQRSTGSIDAMGRLRRYAADIRLPALTISRPRPVASSLRQSQVQAAASAQLSVITPSTQSDSRKAIQAIARDRDDTMEVSSSIEDRQIRSQGKRSFFDMDGHSPVPPKHMSMTSATIGDDRAMLHARKNDQPPIIRLSQPGLSNHGEDRCNKAPHSQQSDKTQHHESEPAQQRHGPNSYKPKPLQSIARLHRSLQLTQELRDKEFQAAFF
jgi:hypothetical protein